MLVKLAFYKGAGTIADRLVRLWTRSPYSHCELIVNGMGMSSSLRDGGVRCKAINFDLPEWDVLVLPWADQGAVWDYYVRTFRQPYSWLDLIRSQIFNRPFDQKKASFCSEWCAAALGLPAPTSLSPRNLLELCVYLNKVKTA